MTDVTVALAEAADVREWSDFLARRFDRPPLGGPEWQQVLSRCYGRDVEGLIARSHGKVIGILTFHYTKRGNNAGKLFSSPWGLVADDAGTAWKLAEEMALHARARGCVAADISSGVDFFPLPGRHRIRHSFVLDLDGDENAIWSGFRSRTRNAIRKGEKGGLQLARGWGLLAGFYDVFSMRMIAKGIPYHPFAYFEAMADVLGARGEIFAALRGGRLEGAMLMVYGTQTAYYGWGAVNPGGDSVRAGQFLLWQMTRACLARGIKRMDLGESTPLSGTANFKTEFGAKPIEIHYYDLLASPSRDETKILGVASLPLSLPGRIEQWAMTHLPHALRGRILQSRRSAGKLI